MSETINLQDRIKKELGDISAAINDIINSYKKLHNPLIESQQQVPEAAQKLDKISAQTEAAATMMLDTIEKITQREEEVINDLTALKVSLKKEDTEIISKLDSIIEKSTENNNDAFILLDALQFQDITTQQLNHAVVLLEQLEGKLNYILGVLTGEEEMIAIGEMEHETNRAFDPHADMFEKKTNQEDIDSLFSKK